MKAMRTHTLALLLLLPTAFRAEGAPSVDLTIDVTSFRLTHIYQDRIEAEVDLTVQVAQDATVEHIGFSNLQANGVPFFAKPLDTTIEVHKGQRTALPPVPVVVYTSDIDSVDPILHILEDEHANLKAEIDLTVEADLLKRLILGTAHPNVIVPIDQSIAAQAPFGPLGRFSAIAVLKATQVGLGSGRSIEQTLNHIGPEWRPQIEAARSGLLHVQSCYGLAEKKVPETLCLDQFATQLAGRQAISSAEIGAPWKFDPAGARSLAHGGEKLQSNTPRIVVRSGVGQSGGEPSEMSGSSSPVTAVNFQQAGNAPSYKAIVLPSHAETEILQRNAPGLFGRLTLPGSAPGAGFQLAPEAVRKQNQWDQLAVYRLVHTDDGRWRAALVILSGSAKDGTVTFHRSVDRSAIGSPILTPDGVIGIVQSETGGTLFTTASDL